MPPYEPPTIIVLGALDELTMGGNDGGPDDGFGMGGDTGSI